MSPGSLVDLDPPPAPERRWPFYIAWAIGGLVVGAVLLSHLPVPLSALIPGSGASAAETSPPARP